MALRRVCCLLGRPQRCVFTSGLRAQGTAAQARRGESEITQVSVHVLKPKMTSESAFSAALQAETAKDTQRKHTGEI